MFGIINTIVNETRPNPEPATAWRERQSINYDAANNIVTALQRTQRAALETPLALVAPLAPVAPVVEVAPPKPVTDTIVRNVISLAARHEAKITAAEAQVLAEQADRINEAMMATEAAHQPPVDVSVGYVGYESAA